MFVAFRLKFLEAAEWTLGSGCVFSVSDSAPHPCVFSRPTSPAGLRGHDGLLWEQGPACVPCPSSLATRPHRGAGGGLTVVFSSLP